MEEANDPEEQADADAAAEAEIDPRSRRRVRRQAQAQAGIRVLRGAQGAHARRLPELGGYRGADRALQGRRELQERDVQEVVVVPEEEAWLVPRAGGAAGKMPDNGAHITVGQRTGSNTPDILVFEDGAGQHVSNSGHHAKIMALPEASAGDVGGEDGMRWGAACVSQAPSACIKVMARRGAPWITLVLGDAAAIIEVGGAVRLDREALQGRFVFDVLMVPEHAPLVALVSLDHGKERDRDRAGARKRSREAAAEAGAGSEGGDGGGGGGKRQRA